MSAQPAPGRALILSGGVALGAFEAGVAAALEESGMAPGWLLGASIGAVNAAILAGNPPGQRIGTLRRFWDMVATEPMPATSLLLGPPPPEGAWRRAHNRAAALETLLLGRPGLFRPRLSSSGDGDAPALYDLAPLREGLPEFVDFDRLNAGETRLTVVATDVESGERVIFDTARGARIGPEHLAGSCALLPIFAPMEVEGRLLGDGGLASNAPLDLALDEPGDTPLLCILVELFARAGSRPRSFAASVARAGDLGFGNQTERMLEARAREHRLHALMDRLVARLPEEARHDPEVAGILEDARREGAARPVTLLRLGYRASSDEVGPAKAFDFSRTTLAERWNAGARVAGEALRRLGSAAEARQLAPSLTLHDIADGPGGGPGGTP